MIGKIPETYLQRLLESSLVYHQLPPEKVTPLPTTFKNKTAAVRAFTQALHFEAHQSFQKKLDSTINDPILHAINLNKKRPGIIAGVNKDKSLEIYRRDTISQAEKNTRLWEIRQVATKANKAIDKMDKRTERLLQKMILREEADKIKQEEREALRQQKQKDKEELKEHRKIEKATEKQRFKEATPEGKKTIKEERQLLREKKHAEALVKKNIWKQKQEERAQKKAEQDALRMRGDASVDAAIDASVDAAIDVPIDAHVDASADAPMDAPMEVIIDPMIDPMVDPMVDPAVDPMVDPQKVTNESSRNIETAIEAISTNGLLELTERANQMEALEDVSTVEFYASPVTYNRHLGALNFTNPHPDILDTILSGKEPKQKDSFRMFLGPPGTGKTYRLIIELKHLLEKYPQNRRFYVTAGSNVGTANLYTRAKSLGVAGSLIMNKNKIPFIHDAEEKKWTTSDRVVFATVSSRSSYKLSNEIFETILVDEAAQLQESCFWGLLRPEVNQVLMAGDTNQLPAVVSSMGSKLFYGRSLMQRLVDLHLPSELLDTQRRMHPDIVKFPNEQFYQNQLKTEYTHKSKLKEVFKIIDVKGKEQKVGTSYSNRAEVDTIKQLVDELKTSYEDIVVISPYSAQCKLLKKHLEIPIHTVDSFQGKEADVVILTTVRVGNNVGFWNDYRRLNVGLTRAKHGLRVVGDVNTWKKQPCALRELAKLV